MKSALSSRLLLLALIVGLMPGCIRSPVAMIASTRPLEQGGYVELKPVEELDCIWYLLGIIPISSGNNLQSAIRDAIRRSGGDALIQVTAETFYQNFILVSRYCSIVQGIGVRSREAMGGGLNVPPPATPLP